MMSIKKTDTPNRVNYEWNTELDPAVSGLPMCSTLTGLKPKLSWLKETIKVLLDVVNNTRLFGELSFDNDYDLDTINQVEQRTTDLKSEIDSLVDDEYSELIADRFSTLWHDFSTFMLSLPAMTGKLKLSEETSTHQRQGHKEFGLEKYDSMFQSTPFPEAAKWVHDNWMFAYLRIAGSNPMLLKRISQLPAKFPLTDAEFNKVLPTDDLSTALAENRVYFLDYEGCESLYAPGGFEKPETGVGYSAPPMALFVVDKQEKRLFPVAIRCGQTSDLAVFLCSDHRDELWGWEMAKTVVQSADEVHHEMVSHLAQTHFVSEAFSVATLRSLGTAHPIYKLLISHYEGTPFINNGAVKFLMQKEQFVDKLFAADRGAVCDEVVRQRLAFDIMASDFPTRIKARGLDDTSALPECPYRDDGMLIWDALSSWVSAYVDIFYSNNSAVINDIELMRWSTDLRVNGKLSGFNGILTVVGLKKLLTIAIFTASAQHAAVNFSQPQWMSYTPAMSGSLSQHIPTDQWGKGNADWLSLLSSFNQASLRVTVYSLLGGVYHGALGAYKTSLGLPILPIRADVELALTAFRLRLAAAEREITERNTTRLHPYEYLLPSKIPASINI